MVFPFTSKDLISKLVSPLSAEAHIAVIKARSITIAIPNNILGQIQARPQGHLDPELKDKSLNTMRYHTNVLPIEAPRHQERIETRYFIFLIKFLCPLPSIYRDLFSICFSALPRRSVKSSFLSVISFDYVIFPAFTSQPEFHRRRDLRQVMNMVSAYSQQKCCSLPPVIGHVHEAANVSLTCSWQRKWISTVSPG